MERHRRPPDQPRDPLTDPPGLRLPPFGPAPPKGRAGCRPSGNGGFHHHGVDCSSMRSTHLTHQPIEESEYAALEAVLARQDAEAKAATS